MRSTELSPLQIILTLGFVVVGIALCVTRAIIEWRRGNRGRATWLIVGAAFGPAFAAAAFGSSAIDADVKRYFFSHGLLLWGGYALVCAPLVYTLMTLVLRLGKYKVGAWCVSVPLALALGIGAALGLGRYAMTQRALAVAVLSLPELAAQGAVAGVAAVLCGLSFLPSVARRFAFARLVLIILLARSVALLVMGLMPDLNETLRAVLGHGITICVAGPLAFLAFAHVRHLWLRIMWSAVLSVGGVIALLLLRFLFDEVVFGGRAAIPQGIEVAGVHLMLLGVLAVVSGLAHPLVLFGVRGSGHRAWQRRLMAFLIVAAAGGAVLSLAGNVGLTKQAVKFADTIASIIGVIHLALFAIASLAAVLPFLLDRLEGRTFVSFIATRHVRSQKSGFLTVVSILSICAVAISSCALSTTVSVMGGFSQDLKRKILGNNAHIVIDTSGVDTTATCQGAASPPGMGRWDGSYRCELKTVTPSGTTNAEDVVTCTQGACSSASGSLAGSVDIAGRLAGTLQVCAGCDVLAIQGTLSKTAPFTLKGNSGNAWKNFDAVLDRVRATPGVVAVTPVVHGEGMVSSAANLAGVIVRGIDAKTIGDVIDLRKNIELPRAKDGNYPLEERLKYLEHPEELLRIPSEEVVGLGSSGEKYTHGIDFTMTSGDDPLPRPSFVPDSDGAPRPGLVIGHELMKTLRVYVGDEVTLVSPLGDLGPMGVMPRTRKFRIAAVFFSGMYEYDATHVYTTRDVAQEYFELKGKISAIDVKVEDAEYADQRTPDVLAAVGREDLRVRDWRDINKNLFSALKLERIATFIILSIAIMVASFCIVSTLLLMITEKAKEIAILKAIGARDGAILRTFMTEGIIIGGIGTIFGVVTGAVICTLLWWFGLRLDPDVYYIDRLPIHVSGVDFLLVTLAALVICTLATIFPAYAASRLRPVDGLRYE